MILQVRLAGDNQDCVVLQGAKIHLLFRIHHCLAFVDEVSGGLPDELHRCLGFAMARYKSTQQRNLPQWQ